LTEEEVFVGAVLSSVSYPGKVSVTEKRKRKGVPPVGVKVKIWVSA
jgi:hypothetical protein